MARTDVRETERRCVPLLPELHAGWRAGRESGAAAARGDLELGNDAADAPFARRRPRRRSRRLLALLHHDPAPGPGNRKPIVARPDGPPPAAAGGAADLFIEAAREAAEAAAPRGSALNCEYCRYRSLDVRTDHRR